MSQVERSSIVDFVTYQDSRDATREAGAWARIHRRTVLWRVRGQTLILLRFKVVLANSFHRHHRYTAGILWPRPVPAIRSL